MLNQSNFKSTSDFEKHVLQKILGRVFPLANTGDQERGQLLEKQLFGEIKGNKNKDLIINDGWDYEIKVFYNDKVHVCKLKKPKNLLKYAYNKMRRLYLFERDNHLCNVTFERCYKLKELDKKKFKKKIKIRYSKSKKYYEVYFNKIDDISYCYNYIKEVK